MRKKDNVLSGDDIETIKSKSRYWDEVSHRENGHAILRQELAFEVNRLGVKTLWALERLAQIEGGEQ